MTRFRSFLRSTLAAAALATAVPATAGDYVFAVPQSLERDQARQVHQDIMTFVTQTAAAGDVIRVVDATAVKTIAVFAIPDGSAAGIANLRKRAVAEGMTAWNRFVKEHYVNAPEGAPEIFLPQLLSHLATQTYADQNPHERDICVLVVGSALYHDAREPDFDMRDGRFPSDGLILASQGRSPYGTADRQGQLRGIHVNLLTLDRTWASDIHQLRVHRTWHLLIDAQGGTLATFTQDPETARARFADCERKPGRTFAWDSSRTLQTMLSHERASTLHQTTKQPEITQKQQTPQKPQTISQIPDEDGRFGRVIRIERQSFRPDAGSIGFHEIGRLARNPVYQPALYGGDPGGVAVSFGGYFTGQRIAKASECPRKAARTGCVSGEPQGPLRLDESSPRVSRAEDGSNPTSPSLSGYPRFNGPISLLFDKDVAGVGLLGGYFNTERSTAIRVFDRQGNLIGGVVNTGTGMEYLALVTDDGSEVIAGLQFSLVGPEAAGFGIDNVRFATRGQIANLNDVLNE